MSGLAKVGVIAGVGGLTAILVFSMVALTAPLPHILVAKETGKDSINPAQLVDVYACDLGIVFLHNGELHYVFGDTIACSQAKKSNTMAHGSDLDPIDGLRFDGWILNGTGQAKELIPSIKESGKEISAIPTAAVSINGTIYIWYMSVRQWIWGGDWIANNASIAYSLDGGNTFTKAQNMTWGGNSTFVEFAVVNAGEPVVGGGLVSNYLYLLSTQAGRAGDAYLLRVDKTKILSQLAYEYYMGSLGGIPNWTSDSSQAVSIFKGPIGECSVVWNAYLGKWVAVGSSYHFGVNIRTASTLWGTWSQPSVAIPTSEYPLSYGGYTHPSMLGENGKYMYLMVSFFIPYGVYLFRVDVSSLRV